MSRHFKKILLPFCLLLLPVASAREKKTPQVLFLGDRVHQTIVQAAAKELGNQVSIQFPQNILAEDTKSALAQIEQLLGKNEWDIIYFNFGMGDLCYKDPSTQEFRIMSKDAGGVRVSTPAQYEQQLDALVQQLKKTNSKLIWGSTTPMVTVHFFDTFQGNRFDANAEQEYNTIAARVMAKHKVPVVDLHGHVMAQFKPEDKHPPYIGYAGEMTKRGQPLHAPLVKGISYIAKQIK